MARYVWSAVALAIGAPNRPGSFSQYFWWIPNFLTVSRNVQITLVAAVCWAIWKIRNKACFDGKLISRPNELIWYACVFLNYWAGLHNAADQDALRTGADMLMALATSTAAGNAAPTMLLDGPHQADDRSRS